MSFNEDSNAWKLIKHDQASSLGGSLDRRMREPARNTAARDAPARSTLQDGDQVVLRHLDVYFSCSTCAAATHRLVQDVRGTFRRDDPFALDQRPHHIQAFKNYQSAMRLTIEDFLARGRVSADVLLESCRRLHEREQGEASVAVAYVLACEYFESFMRLMRRVDRPRRSTRQAGALSSGSGRSYTEDGEEEEEQEEGREAWPAGASTGTFNNMDMSSTLDTTDSRMSLGTDMALATPSSAHGQYDSFLGSTHPRRGEQREDLRFLAMQFYQKIHQYYFSNAADTNSSGKDAGAGAGGSSSGGGGGGGGGGGDWGNDNVDEKSDPGSEEEFPEPDPSDPTDGGLLACLGRRSRDATAR